MSATYVIERGIPAPSPTTPKYNPKYVSLWPLVKEMQVGDSVYVPDAKPVIAAVFSKMLRGGKFRALKNGAGSRVWRVG